jgi:hypothetical protein
MNDGIGDSLDLVPIYLAVTSAVNAKLSAPNTPPAAFVYYTPLAQVIRIYITYIFWWIW